MPNPFAKKRVTQAERTAILAEARKAWDNNAFNFLVARGDIVYLQSIDDGLEVTDAQFVPPAPLSAAESAEFSRQIHSDGLFSQVFGNRAEKDEIPEWYRKTHEENQRREREELLGPARRAENSLSAMIEKAVEEAVAEALRRSARSSNRESIREALSVRPAPEREALAPMARMAVEEDSTSDVARFLAAYVAGDEQAQRRIVREMVSA
jgi:hypothetical protein